MKKPFGILIFQPFCFLLAGMFLYFFLANLDSGWTVWLPVLLNSMFMIAAGLLASKARKETVFVLIIGYPLLFLIMMLISGFDFAVQLSGLQIILFPIALWLIFTRPVEKYFNVDASLFKPWYAKWRVRLRPAERPDGLLRIFGAALMITGAIAIISVLLLFPMPGIDPNIKQLFTFFMLVFGFGSWAVGVKLYGGSSSLVFAGAAVVITGTAALLSSWLWFSFNELMIRSLSGGELQAAHEINDTHLTIFISAGIVLQILGLMMLQHRYSKVGGIRKEE